jgi:glycerol-3-phosphate dehydrogenase
MCSGVRSCTVATTTTSAKISRVNCHVTYRQFNSGGKSSGNHQQNSGGSSFFRRFTQRSFPPDRDPGLATTSVISNPKEVEGPRGVPSRAEQVRRLEHPIKDQYDILVIGGGATGAGVAMDASSRGLSVACIERGDFASETSSRSTKLIWAGIRYMATASAALVSTNLFTSPISTVKDFLGEMKMVLQCHKERQYMTEQQEHLCNWIPIAIPFTQWHVSPPPFGHWLFGFFPILAPAVLKFYDSLSFFSCPGSYILTAEKAKNIFPQLQHRNIKYCAVFYEAQHNDARTNIAIAMTAAEFGAAIANYVEMINTIKDEETGKVIGVEALDRMTGRTFSIHAKKVVFAGGPFTDSLREMEQTGKVQPAVRGASGTHIVLPGYYCPNNVSNYISTSLLCIVFLLLMAIAIRYLVVNTDGTVGLQY